MPPPPVEPPLRSSSSSSWGDPSHHIQQPFRSSSDAAASRSVARWREWDQDDYFRTRPPPPPQEAAAAAAATDSDRMLLLRSSSSPTRPLQLQRSDLLTYDHTWKPYNHHHHHHSNTSKTTPRSSGRGGGGGGGGDPDSHETKPTPPTSQSALLFEHTTCSRKKQRLGWGQGLAKYEKKHKLIVVEASDETLAKPPPLLLPCQTSSESASPLTTTTSSSLPCCSNSPGTATGFEEKDRIKAAHNVIDMCNVSASPDQEFQSCLEEFSANIEYSNSANNLSSLLDDLLPLDDSNSGDSNFVKSTAMNKLLLVKTELSKALEKTECEIDLFENELRLFDFESEIKGSHLVASDSLQREQTRTTCEHVHTSSQICQKPAPLKVVTSIDMYVGTSNLCNETLEEVHGEVKDDDIDSPGTATSKFVEPLCIEKEQSACSMGNGCSTAVMVARFAASELPWFSPVYEEKSVSVSGDEDGIRQIGSSTTTDGPSDLNQDCNLNDLILVSNRDSARKAFEVFSKLMPANQSEIDIWRSCLFSCQENKLHVKQKLASRKCFQRFKERVLTLKFRALQHLWKEDLRLLSIRKYKAKSQKRIESNLKIPIIVQQKHRSSIRSRFTSPAGSLTLVPTSEIVEFTSKLLSDSQTKFCRDTLKMPALVDERERRMLKFVSNSGLVKDPGATEKERLMINPWTPNEKEVFLENLATYGKDFKKIASCLDHKTTADCVEFYYKNHKSESFEKIKKKSELKKQEKSTYLMTSDKKWNREVNADSLDLLGEASVIAAHADSTIKSQHTSVSGSYFGGNYTTCCGDDASYEKSSYVENEREATAVDTLAGICGALSSEAMSSCVTSSVDPGESCQEGKFMKNSVSDRPLTPTCVESIDDEETCSDESCGEMDSMDWTDEEKSNFTDALRSYGKDFVKIARCVRSRSRDQCKVFFSKARKSLDLEVPHFGIGRGGTLLSDDADGGRSDTEDACVLEIESAICSTQSCSKVDIDCSLSVDCEASDRSTTNHLQTDVIHRLEENNGFEKLNNLQINEPERSGESDGLGLLNNEGVSVGEKCEPDHRAELVIFGEGSSVNGVGESFDGSAEIMQPNNISTTDSPLVCNPSEMLHVDARLAHSTESVKQQKTTVLVEESNVSDRQAGVSSDAFESKVMLGASNKVLKTESMREQNLASGCGDGRNRKIMWGVNSNTRSSSWCFAPDSKISKSSSYPATGTSFRRSFSLTRKMQPQICQELLHSVQSTQTISLKKESTNISANSVLPGSSHFHYEDHLRQGSPSTLNFERARNEQHPVPESADAYRTHLLCHHLNRDESSQILRGYPLQTMSKKDINGHCLSIGKQSITTNSTRNGTFPCAPFIAQDYHYDKCNSSEVPSLADEIPTHEKSSVRHIRSHSQGSTNADDPGKNGDVKLFGKILNHSSTIQKPNPMTWETDKEATHLKSSSNVFDVKFTDQGTDRASVISRLDANKYSGVDDFPARSYSCWDGSRIQTGVSSHPDSSVLLGRYPVPFGGYSAASSCGDQQSLRNLSSPSVYCARDVSSNGSSLDYQVYRGYDGCKMQPFTVDIKRGDAFSDLQKRNGIDAPCFQKQSRGVVGVNVMGPGLLVGGGCTDVSDPVAAIKMHHATTERYAGQSESIREEDSWRGIGR